MKTIKLVYLKQELQEIYKGYKDRYCDWVIIEKKPISIINHSNRWKQGDDTKILVNHLQDVINNNNLLPLLSDCVLTIIQTEGYLPYINISREDADDDTLESIEFMEEYIDYKHINLE